MAASVFEQLDGDLNRALDSSGEFEPSNSFATNELPLSPWAIWLLFSLVRHERRQLWVAEVAASRLGVDLDLISARCARTSGN